MPNGETELPGPGWVCGLSKAYGLELICWWLNSLDGLLTTCALVRRRSVELNVIMRVSWKVSPLLYISLKFWLFWIGLRLLDSATHPRDLQVRERILLGTITVFLVVLLWHLVGDTVFC